MLSSTPYLSSKKWKHKNTLLGTQSFLSRTHDSLTVVEPVRGKADSLLKVAPQVRIPINTQFVKDIFLMRRHRNYRQT